MAEKEFTPQQLVFIDKFLQSGNATQSYKDAGYKAKNDNVAAASAHKLLRTPKIASYIRDERDRLRREGKVNRDDLLAKNAEIAFSNIDDVIKVEDGRIVLKDNVQSLNQFDGVSATYTLTESRSEKHATDKGGGGFSESTTESKSFNLKRPDRLKALDQLARLLGEYDRDENDSGRDLKNSAERILSALAKVRSK
jgi:phage terminase small subunit